MNCITNSPGFAEIPLSVHKRLHEALLFRKYMKTVFCVFKLLKKSKQHPYSVVVLVNDKFLNE